MVSGSGSKDQAVVSDDDRFGSAGADIDPEQVGHVSETTASEVGGPPSLAAMHLRSAVRAFWGDPRSFGGVIMVVAFMAVVVVVIGQTIMVVVMGGNVGHHFART